MSYAAIPAALRMIPRWLLYISGKIPYYLDGGRRSGTLDGAADSARLAGFKAASALLKRSLTTVGMPEGPGYVGLGFALGAGVGGVDLDNCIDEAGRVGDWAQAIVEALDSYTEKSPSGRGLHIIVRCDADLRPLGANGTGVEFYPGKRYFTMTGEVTRKRPVGKLTQAHYDLLTACHEPQGKVVRLKPLSDPLPRSPSMWEYQKIDAEKMLPFIPPNLPRAQWLTVGMALHHASGGTEDAYRMWHDWSAPAENYNAKDWPGQWESFARGFKGAPVTFASLVKLAREHGYDQRPAARPERVMPGNLPKEFSLSDLLEMDIPPTEWMVEGLIAPGLTLLAAPPKQGKSYLALQVCLAVAAGVPVLGRKTGACKVVYFDLEEWHGLLRERVKPIMAGHGIAGMVPLKIKLETGVDDGALADMQKEIDAGAKLLVVDLLARIRDEMSENARQNAYARDYRAIARLADFALKQTNVAIIVVHHANKSAHDNWIDKISGSAGIAGAAHTALYMARPDLRGMSDEDKEEAMRYRVLHAVGKLVKQQDITIEMMAHDAGWQLSALRPWEVSTTRKQKDILLALAELPLRAWTARQVATRLGLQVKACASLMNRMAKNGTIYSDGQGGDGYRLRRDPDL